jgi:hypothetical protein
MEIRGKFKAFNTQTISTKNGDKTKGELVIDVPDQNYPYVLAFDIWNDKTKEIATSIPVGTEINVSFDVKSREYQGKYFTSASAWRIYKVQEASGTIKQNAPPQMDTPPSMRSPIVNDGSLEDDEDTDLPF